MCEAGMCVCIKRLINSTFLWRGLLGCPDNVVHVGQSGAIILSPLWLQPLCSHGHPFWFLRSWLWGMRRDPEGLHSPGRVVPANIPEGESQRESHSMRKGCSLCYCAPCMRIFLFQELKGGNWWCWYSDWRAPNATIFLVSMGPFFFFFFSGHT